MSWCCFAAPVFPIRNSHPSFMSCIRLTSFNLDCVRVRYRCAILIKICKLDESFSVLFPHFHLTFSSARFHMPRAKRLSHRRREATKWIKSTLEFFAIFSFVRDGGMYLIFRIHFVITSAPRFYRHGNAWIWRMKKGRNENPCSWIGEIGTCDKYTKLYCMYVCVIGCMYVTTIVAIPKKQNQCSRIHFISFKLSSFFPAFTDYTYCATLSAM